MRRREFIAVLGSLVAARPFAARAEQIAVPVIGFLSSRSAGDSVQHVAAFRRGLEEAGYVEGDNIRIEYRWADGQYERAPALAAELVARGVTAIVATGGAVSAQAARTATRTIPVLFLIGGDPVANGLVASFNRPGGNATGVSFITSALGAKRLELLSGLVPDASLIGLLINPNTADSEFQTEDVQTAARSLGRQLLVARASAPAELDAGFAALADGGAKALILENDPFFDSRRDQIVALAARYRLPAIYHIREYPDAGGLMSYGASLADGYYQLALQTARVLKGASPADLPVLRSTRFELVINLKTAKSLGLTVPQTILVAADALVE
ncbi:MAG TPA: ABC transporter substrate-binding protein [Stellaceae bacterium]|nr:ABC transporter substrate-binding protein [Stellaceae bacterium]